MANNSKTMLISTMTSRPHHQITYYTDLKNYHNVRKPTNNMQDKLLARRTNIATGV